MPWSTTVIDTTTISGSSTSWGASTDGSVIVGIWNPPLVGHVQPFKWTAGTGCVSLPTFNNLPIVTDQGVAYDCSADGTVIVGNNSNSITITPYPVFWDAGGTVHLVGFPAPSQGELLGVSEDGSVAVGVIGGVATQVAIPSGVPFALSLPVGPAWTDSVCYACSSDGSWKAGSATVGGDVHGIVWNGTAGIDVGTLPGGIYPVAMQDISADGSVAVGFATDSGGIARPIAYYTATNTMVQLSSSYQVATAVSDNGSVIVGYDNYGGDSFIWTLADGVLPLVSGSTPLGISGDGTRPVGDYPALYFSYSTPPPPGGGTLGIDMLRVLCLEAQSACTIQQFGTTYASTVSAQPVVGLRWSDTRGATWGNPVPQELSTNPYSQPQWNRTGYARDRVYEIFWSADLQVAVNGAFVEFKQLKS